MAGVTVRQKIWARLPEVAVPDSRFHHDFAEVIPDFVGSADATDRAFDIPAVRNTRFAFATPDNSLVELRRRFIASGVPLVVSSFRIRRGFFIIEPGSVPAGHELYAAWLDGLEHFGKPITLTELARRGRFDLLATGASAVSIEGVRFGKGHDFFDIEWALFTTIGIVDDRTPIVAIVHDRQVVDTRLFPSPADILIDAVVTPTRTIAVTRTSARPRDLRWDELDPSQIDAMPPLAELRRLQGLAA